MMMSRIGQDPGIGTVDYEQLREAVGLSKAQINRIFKAATGLTPRQWSEVHSIKAAEDWLRSGQLSIKEIAAQLNFFDASHFIKWFRRHAGCTPKTWRTRKKQRI
jgi:AraC-like DNA-binding protein